jgi:hypothetical protein
MHNPLDTTAQQTATVCLSECNGTKFKYVI